MKRHPYYQKLKRLKGKELRYFIAGFVDGEGSFNVSFSRHTLRSGWIVNTKFQVYQHETHQDILDVIRDVFGAGRIRKKSGSNVLVLSIDSRRTQIERVIPFFERYTLATKQHCFEEWRRIVLMINDKQHLTKKGFARIVDIAHEMNQQGKGRKWDKKRLLENLDSLT